MLMMLAGRASRRDPTTFIAAFGMWSIICSVSLLLPGNVFERTNVYGSMATIYPEDFWWGIVMCADGLLLQSSLFSRRVSFKSSVAAFSAVLWMMIGSLMLFDGWTQGFFVITGAYSVWGAIGCFMAITQWIYSGGD